MILPFDFRFCVLRVRATLRCARCVRALYLPATFDSRAPLDWFCGWIYLPSYVLPASSVDCAVGYHGFTCRKEGRTDDRRRDERLCARRARAFMTSCSARLVRSFVPPPRTRRAHARCAHAAFCHAYRSITTVRFVLLFCAFYCDSGYRYHYTPFTYITARAAYHRGSCSYRASCTPPPHCHLRARSSIPFLRSSFTHAAHARALRYRSRAPRCAALLLPFTNASATHYLPPPPRTARGSTAVQFIHFAVRTFCYGVLNATYVLRARRARARRCAALAGLPLPPHAARAPRCRA